MSFSTRSHRHTISLICSVILGAASCAGIMKYINLWVGAAALVIMALAITIDWGTRSKRRGYRARTRTRDGGAASVLLVRINRDRR